jgi:hypothetical protein
MRKLKKRIRLEVEMKAVNSNCKQGKSAFLTVDALTR